MRTVVLSLAMLWLGCSESEEGLAPGTVPLSEYVPTDRNQTGTPTGGSSESEGSEERDQGATVTAGAGSELPGGPEALVGDEAAGTGTEVAGDEVAGDDEVEDEPFTGTLTPPGTVLDEADDESGGDALEACTGSESYSRCVIERFDEGRGARTCGQVQAVYAAYRDLGNSGAAERMLTTRNERCGAEGAAEGAPAAE